MTLTFEGHAIPDGVDWSEYLSAYLTPPYSLAPGDERPLDWIERFLKVHPEHRHGIGQAYVSLLFRGDVDVAVRAQILEQIPSFPETLLDGLFDLLDQEHPRLSIERDPIVPGQSLLGRLVRAVYRMTFAERAALPATTAHVLETITEREHGWPESLTLALRGGGPAGQRVVSEVDRMADDELAEFVRRLCVEADPVRRQAFGELARSARRDEVAAIAREAARPNPDAHQFAARYAQARGLPPPPPPRDLWPELAGLLGVPV